MHKIRCGFRLIPSKFYQGSYQSKAEERKEQGYRKRCGEQGTTNNLVTVTGLLSLKKTRPILPIFCRLKCHTVMGRILDVSWWLAEGSERYWNCGHPMRLERVCRSCLQTTRRQTHELYSTLETQLCRDTNVLVLLLAHRQDLCQEISMFFSTSRTKRYFAVHKISLAEEKRKSLLAFHTITGCDTTSQSGGTGKQSALKILDSSSKLNEHIGKHCPPEESVLADAEAFVCQL